MASDNEKRDSYPEGYRWDLAEKFRERANHAANIIRGIVVAVSGGSTYFLVNKFYDNFGIHFWSVACFALAIGTTVCSWDIQKAKAAERLTALRDKGYDHYLELERIYQGSLLKKNYILDRLACAFLAVGLLIEAGVVFRITK